MTTDIPSDTQTLVPEDQLIRIIGTEKEINRLLTSNHQYFKLNWFILNELDDNLINDLKDILNTLCECVSNTDNRVHRAFTFALSDHFFTKYQSSLMLYEKLEDTVSTLSKQSIRIINNFIDTKQPIPSDFLENELLRICKIYDCKLAEQVERIIGRCRVAEYKLLTRNVPYLSCSEVEFICVYDSRKRVRLEPAKIICSLIENNPLIHC